MEYYNNQHFVVLGGTPLAARDEAIPVLTGGHLYRLARLRPALSALIRSGYVAAVVKAGVPIRGDVQVTLAIKDYSERGVAVRSVSLVAGPLRWRSKTRSRLSHWLMANVFSTKE